MPSALPVSQECPSGCGVRVTGEVERGNREFVHQFHLPSGLESFAGETRTEVEGIRLVTFPPSGEWSVECPLCRRAIAVPREAASIV